MKNNTTYWLWLQHHVPKNRRFSGISYYRSPRRDESPSLVNKGFLQIETGGFATETKNGIDVKETTFITLLRWIVR
jgi:hypothetical protein